MKKKIITLMLTVWASAMCYAQLTPVSEMERLGRGLIALPAQNQGIFVSWRFLGYDNRESTTFEILRGGKSIAKDLTVTNYRDASGKKSDTYQVVTFVDGQPVDTTAAVTPWDAIYKKLVLDRPATGSANGGTYAPNDCSVGDVDGDGEYEIIVKWEPSNSKDNSQDGITDNVFLDCYKLNGTKLWRIDLGRNIRSGAHYTQFMVYDFDGDGKSELMCKTAPGTKDGKGSYVNSVATDATIKAVSGTASYVNSSGRTNSGQEWLTVFKGETGEAVHTIFYNPNRNMGYGGAANASVDWYNYPGKQDIGYNRGDRFLAGVAYLDGPDKPASGIFCRGYYTFAFIWAVDFDGHMLHQKWLHASRSTTQYSVTTYDADGKGTTKTYTSGAATSGGGNRTMYGNGNHNMSIADVDGDGCDEVIWGSAALNHDGTLRYATGFGHGDAMHMSDLNPERPGLEVFQVHEEGGTYAWDVHDANTGEVLLKGGPSGVDNGRGIAAQLDANHHGFYFSSGKDKQQRSAVTGEVMSAAATALNFRVYWDGDLQDELLDGGVIDDWKGNGTERIIALGNYGPGRTCNSTKNTPNLMADIFGDWREEVILHDGAGTLAIYSTNIPTGYRVPTLMHDHTYRMGVCWENVAYNQPPHLGYYLPDSISPSAQQPVPEPEPEVIVTRPENPRWDFTRISAATIADLTADADSGDETGWSDQEYLATSDPVGNKCFWYHSDTDYGTLKANGKVIKEYEGLYFPEEFCSKRNLAIAADYPTTSIGTYHGGQYLWLGQAGTLCFVIPKVKAGTEIVMGVESHRNGSARGVQLFLNNGTTTNAVKGQQLNAPNGSEVAVPDAYTDQAWLVPEDAGTVDVLVYNTSGCHVYYVDAIQADDIHTGINDVRIRQPKSNVVYNLNGQSIMLNAQSSKLNLKPGVYIVNGKKYVVR